MEPITVFNTTLLLCNDILKIQAAHIIHFVFKMDDHQTADGHS